MKAFVYFLFFIVWGQIVAAQDIFTSQHYSTIDGLPHNIAHCYAQDTKGYLWIGTRNGISRFDGYAFRNFKLSRQNGVRMGHNRIEQICMSSTDKLWVTTYDRMLYLFNPETERFDDPFENQQPALGKKVFCLPGGITWVSLGRNRLYRIDENSDAVRNAVFPLASLPAYPEEDDEIHAVYQDEAGNEWLLGSRKVTVLKGGKHHTAAHTPYHFILEADHKVVLLSKEGKIAVQPVGGEGTVQELAFLPEGISDAARMGEDAFLVATPASCRMYRLKGGQLQKALKEDWGMMNPHKECLLTGDQIFYAFVSDKEIVRRDLNADTEEILPCPSFSGVQTDKRIRLIYEDSFGQVWIFTREGLLCYYNSAEHRILPATYNRTGERHYYMEQIRNLYIDRHRNLWVGTDNGIDNLTFRRQDYEWITTSPRQTTNRQSAEQREVRGIFEDNHNHLWLSMKNEKIEIYDRENKYVGNLAPDGRIVPDYNQSFGARIYCIYQDKDNNLWMGSKDKGLFVLYRTGRSTYTVRQYLPQADDRFSISSNSVYAILQDSYGRMWIGTFGGGVNLVERGGGYDLKFVHSGNGLAGYPMKECYKVRCLYETDGEVMMVGTTGGLVTFSTRFDHTDHITFYRNYMENDRSDCLSSNDIVNLLQDRRGDVYVSTFNGGINVPLHPDSLLSNRIRFKSHNQENGLASDVVLSAIEDLKGNIWVASSNAFTEYNVENNTFDYIRPDLLKERFAIGEALPIIDRNGDFIFGTTNGALRLFVNQMQRSSICPNVVFTDANIQAKEKTYSKKILLNSIELAPEERNFSISFAALDFSNPHEIKYAYRTEESDGGWNYIGNSRSISFTNISPGRHTLQVKSTNGDGVWVDNATSLSIYVVPTFWETGYARIVYALAAVVIILLSVYIISYVLNLRREVVFEHRLTELKLKFFTDISHELRTPLTLIAGPIDEMLGKEQLTANGKKLLNVAKRNTDRMLKLVNQILDFRKVQNNKMNVCLQYTDIAATVQKVYLSFMGIAQEKDIRFTYLPSESPCLLYTDTDKVEKILFNLLSNAFKYTPSHRGISLSTRMENGFFVMKVSDEGTGFDSWKKERLFMRFETDNEADPNMSTGIGLALTKELVRILHGTIDVESVKGKGSCFTVQLPVDTKALAGDPNVTLVLDDMNRDGEAEEKKVDSAPAEAAGGSKDAKVLIIEDNDELRSFIAHVLGEEYEVAEAVNGKEGLEKTRELNPDLVVCDIMMPVMDGIEYLNALKGNPETSHIPVLFLTAKSSIDDQIKGMEYGADDYITKPFNIAYLQAKITSLIRRREALREFYLSRKGAVQVQASESSWEPSVPQITHFDDEFMTKVIQGIEENIENPEFKIDILANAMNMSRSVFYRKIKAIVGLSPIDFVKNIRIKRVMQLMDTGQFSVTEIAYKCGFSSSQYLSRVFKEVTGETPTEYMKKLQEKR